MYNNVPFGVSVEILGMLSILVEIWVGIWKIYIQQRKCIFCVKVELFATVRENLEFPLSIVGCARCTRAGETPHSAYIFALFCARTQFQSRRTWLKQYGVRLYHSVFNDAHCFLCLGIKSYD